ncbi:MAG: ribosomal RNA small subunit methyltransferase A [Chloroflexi bacterium]|nr:ribosomal RNA small subunit methyltransferase A [Chloroflexota bacterium]
MAPKKSLGQNFLHDPNTLARIVDCANLVPDATVLEIGAGTGLLTRRLAANVGHVIAVEADERLKPILEASLDGYTNVDIHWGDFLKADIMALVGDKPYSVVANLPYYITSAIIRKLLEAPNPPTQLIITVQKEVAERILAQPGEMGVLAVSVQFYGHPELISRLKPAVFWPRPEVESAVLRITVYDKPAVDVPDTDLFFRVVRAGFGQKRKQLKNALAKGLNIRSTQAQAVLEQADIQPSRRAETLALEEWAALCIAVAQAT